MVESAAAAHGLPFEFFARVIWQESRFRSHAVGPVTRSGWQAQGIAQFMPMTAAERLLRNPFDPAQALPKSAEFLRELRAQFGNLGLAAAAYKRFACGCAPSVKLASFKGAEAGGVLTFV
jgi:soluble lytic murein transglycosylase-like protein